MAIYIFYCFENLVNESSTKTLHVIYTNHKAQVSCTSSHGEKLWRSRLHWKEVVGPEPANSTVAVSPFTVTPSLIRCTVHILGFAVYRKIILNNCMWVYQSSYRVSLVLACSNSNWRRKELVHMQ